MKIGELAKAAATDVETLRYYERIGLLAPPLRAANGYRHYPPQALREVRFIRHCRELGIGLAAIGRIMALAREPEAGCDEVNDLLAEQLAQVRARLQALQVLERQLLALQGRCDAGGRSADCGILHELMAAAEQAQCACHGATGALTP